MSDIDIEQSRLIELSVDAALGVLGGDDAIEFATLLARHPQFDRSSFDQAVGASFIALNPGSEPLPERLVIEIARQADRYFAIDRPAPLVARVEESASPTSRDWGWGPYAGWLAAAASLLLAIGIWTSGRDTSSESVARAPHDPPASGPAAQRENLLASTRFVLKRKWTSGPAAVGSAIGGDVVWDGTAQEGYLRFVGLRRNDPSFEQYQLWIFDATRDERFPIDGGVFDVNESGEVVVPIRAQLRVRTPTLFAVTLEPPGGVVVSSRERIVALATIG